MSTATASGTAATSATARYTFTSDTVRQAVIDGLDSAQAEGTGWDSVVKAGLPTSAVARTSDSVVTITLSAFASYNITAQETITATVPALALAAAALIVATPTFTVAAASPLSTAAAGLASAAVTLHVVRALTGTATGVASAAAVLTIAGATTFNSVTVRNAIIQGLDSAQAEGTGWDAVVKAGLSYTAVVRTSDTVVTITLPAFPSYDITALETITATVPAVALTGAAPLVATPTVAIALANALQAAGSSGAATTEVALAKLSAHRARLYLITG